MTCIHGFDEITCPTCRITRATLPKNNFGLEEPKSNLLRPIHPFIKRNADEKEVFIDELALKRPSLTPNSINMIPRPNFLNPIPNFENKMLLERLNEIDIGNTHGISKKIKINKHEIPLPRS